MVSIDLKAAALPNASQAASMPRVEARGDDDVAHTSACALGRGGALGCRRPLERDAAGNPPAQAWQRCANLVSEIS